MTLTIRPREFISPLWTGVALLVMGGLSLWLALRGEPYGQMIVAIGMPHCAGPVLLLGWLTTAVLSAPADRSQRMVATVKKLTGALAFRVPVQAPLFFLAVIVQEKQVTEAKRWCEDLAGKLEEWREVHGSYPEVLDGSPLAVDPPQRCASGLIYHVRDGRISLDFGTGDWVASWTYDSGDRSKLFGQPHQLTSAP